MQSHLGARNASYTKGDLGWVNPLPMRRSRTLVCGFAHMAALTVDGCLPTIMLRPRRDQSRIAEPFGVNFSTIVHLHVWTGER
jgi:hypothetical protein